MTQQVVGAREQSVDRIVVRRVEELADPNLNWTRSEDEQNPLASTRLCGNRWGEAPAERYQLCLGKAGTPPAVIAPGANVIYLSAKRPSGSSPDATPSGSSVANAEFLK